MREFFEELFGCSCRNYLLVTYNQIWLYNYTQKVYNCIFLFFYLGVEKRGAACYFWQYFGEKKK